CERGRAGILGQALLETPNGDKRGRLVRDRLVSRRKSRRAHADTLYVAQRFQSIAQPGTSLRSTRWKRPPVTGAFPSRPGLPPFGGSRRSKTLGEPLERFAHDHLWHVEDQAEGPDLGREHERQPPVAHLLVTSERFDDGRRLDPETAHRQPRRAKKLNL